MSVWNPDNIRDVSESVGVVNLTDEVLNALSSDVEYRLSQVLEEALKFMRHSRRNTLTTQDVSQALRILDVEPLYGYESTRPVRYGEASLGPGQPLFYVEDEEVDFEKLINAPLPKVPREISFSGMLGDLREVQKLTSSGHWLAVEGVQPSIPQNPTTADSRSQELMPKGVGMNPNLGAISGMDNVAVKPLVKHILSKELQMFFERVCSAVLDENDENLRQAALSSLRTDTSLHQLIPYFVQFIAEKVTHNLKNLFVLHQMLDFTSEMLRNENLFIDPYVASLVPPVLTCLTTPHLGSASNPLDHYTLRNKAASLIGFITKKFSKTSHSLKSRLTRTCLKQFLEPKKPLQVHYGALRGLVAISGREAVRGLLIPTMKSYNDILQEALDSGTPIDKDAEMVLGAIIEALMSLKDEGGPLINGYASGDVEAQRAKLEGKFGTLIAQRVVREGSPELVQTVMEA